MCTVSWINGIVTSVRDDVPSKSHLSNMKQRGDDFVILMNRKGPKGQNKSRAEVVNRILDEPNMSFEGFTPFTLILYKHQTLFEIIWNGKETFEIVVDMDSTQLWRSNTLYSEDEAWKSYEDLMEWKWGNSFIPSEIYDYHVENLKYPGNDRGTTTLSINQIIKK